MKITTEKVIDYLEWNKLVEKTYKRPYNFQQQDGCKSSGIRRFKVPDEEAADDFETDTLTEDRLDMGVSFAAWLARDPKQKLSSTYDEDYYINLWWYRNFYPDFQMVANDLYKKGLLEAGDYMIVID